MQNLISGVLLLFFYIPALAQRKADITINLDSSIDYRNVRWVFNTGKGEINNKDTISSAIIHIKSRFYSKLATVKIIYKAEDNNYYSNEFFIGSKPATISISENPLMPEMSIRCKQLINATPLYDTSQNHFFKSLANSRLSAGKKIASLYQHNNGIEVNGNDSLFNVLKNYYKELNDSSIQFLKSKPKKYLSFAYFIRQVGSVSLVYFRRDTTYLKSLLSIMDTLFPKRFTNSPEGRKIRFQINALTNAPDLNSAAPLFTAKDLKGEKISLASLKGNYILLDFWASWCGPCLRDLPQVKRIYNSLSSKNFLLLGISIDSNPGDARKIISNFGIGWRNILDKNENIFNLFGVTSVPTKILINPQGRIIYRSDMNEDDALFSWLLKKITTENIP